MPIQQMTMYTASGYSGALCDSAEKVVQTGSCADSTILAGVCVAHKISYAPNGVSAGILPTGVTAEATAEGISLRDLDLEAYKIPAKKGDWHHIQGNPLNILREGFVKVKLWGSKPIKVGEHLHSDLGTGKFSKDGLYTVINVIAVESGNPLDIIKVRIDHVK